MTYTHKTYPIACVRLDTGMYTREELLAAIEEMDIRNAKAIAAMQRKKQAGWMPIPKPLTNEEIIETCDTWVISDIGSDEVIKIVRRTELAHGIGEKE